jgi:hypothetical protein
MAIETALAARILTMKILLTLTLLITTSRAISQNTVEQALADSACKYIALLDFKKLTTREQKKQAFNNCLLYAAKQNEKLLIQNGIISKKQTPQQTQQVGFILSQKVTPILIKDCYAIKELMR